MGWGGDINSHIHININIDVHIITNMDGHYWYPKALLAASSRMFLFFFDMPFRKVRFGFFLHFLSNNV